MIDSFIDDFPTQLDEEIKEEVEGNLFDVGAKKEFKLTAELTNRKQWTLYGDVELDSKNEKVIRWSTDPATNAVNITAKSEIDLAIPKEVAWLKDSKSFVWSRVEYLRNNTIEDPEHQLSQDAHTFLAYDRSMAHLHSNILHIIQHTPEGDLAIRQYSRELMDEIVRASMLEVIGEVLHLRTKAFNTVTRIFLKGVMDINLESERLLKLSGRLTLVQGAVRDFISNHNHLLHSQEQSDGDNKPERILFKRIRDAIRQKVSFIPHHIELHTDNKLIMDTTSPNRSLFLQPIIDRENEFYHGIRNDHVPIEFMFQIIPSSVTAVVFFDHYHQHHHLHKQHHHYQQQNQVRANMSLRTAHVEDDFNYSAHNLAQEETILIAGHENGTISLWRLLFTQRHKPHAPIFLAANNRAIPAGSNNHISAAVRDIQLHPLDPYSILTTQDDGEISWFRVRLSTFDYYYGDLELAQVESPTSSPQKRNQQLVVQSQRSGGLLSLLLQCFRRSKPSSTANAPSIEGKKSKTKEGTGIMNSHGKEISQKQFTALHQIVSFVAEDLPYDLPNLPEDRFWQEEDKKRQLLQRYVKEKLTIAKNVSSWFSTNKSNDSKNVGDDDKTNNVEKDQLERKFGKEYSKLLIHPYQRADYRPRPMLGCFHPAINRMTSATSLMIAATSGDVYKFNVDMILADMSNATKKEEKKNSDTNNFAMSVSFKQFASDKPNSFSVTQQWRLVPPYDATSLHVTEEFVLPQQAPPGFLLKKPTFESNEINTDNQINASPRKQKKQFPNRTKLPGRSQVFREILHFHRATHSIPATMDGKLEQFFLQYPALRSMFAGNSQPCTSRSNDSPESSLLLFLQNQHRILLISPLQSSCFNPFHSPINNKHTEKRSQNVDVPPPWNVDSLISVDSGGCIALWRTQEEAGYQHCHWHVPRVSLRLHALLSSSANSIQQQQYSTSTLQTFERVNSGKMYFINHPIIISNNVHRKENENAPQKDNNKQKKKSTAKLSPWQKFLRQQHIQLRVQQRSLFHMDDNNGSKQFLKASIKRYWTQCVSKSSSNSTTTDSNKEPLYPQQWIHTEFSPIFLSQLPPIMFAVDEHKNQDQAPNITNENNNNNNNIPTLVTDNSLPRQTFWKFHKLQLVDDLTHATDPHDDAPHKSNVDGTTVWLAEEMKPSRYEYLIMMAKVSDDKDVLSLLLHCIEETSSSTAEHKRQHWRIVSLYLKELQLSSVQIVIAPPAQGLYSDKTNNKNNNYSYKNNNNVPYVRDFAISSIFNETVGHGRLVAVLVNNIDHVATNDTNKASCTLRFFSTLTGEEVALSLHGNNNTNNTQNNQEYKTNMFQCHGDWHRIQWCPSFRYIALYTSPVYTSFTAQQNSKNNTTNTSTADDTHSIEYYYYLRGLKYDEEDNDTNVLLQKWFQQGNIEQLPSFLIFHPTLENNKQKKSHAVSQGNSSLQLIRLRHILDRDLLALSQWQSIHRHYNSSHDNNDSNISLDDASSLQKQQLYLRNIANNLRESENIYQTILHKEETSLIPAVDEDIEQEAIIPTTDLSTITVSKATLEFLLRPLPDELSSLSDQEEDVQENNTPLSMKMTGLGSVSGKLYQKKQRDDLWQYELTRSVKTWILECVDDALSIVEIHARASHSKKLLADLFASDNKPNTQNRGSTAGNNSAALSDVQYGGIPPTRWPVPETITASVEAVLAERRKYYEKLYRRVMAREQKGSRSPSHSHNSLEVNELNLVVKEENENSRDQINQDNKDSST